MQMGGFIKMDLSGSFFMDEVMNGNYGKIKASGGIDVDDVLLKGTDGLDLFASMASVRLGSNVKDSIRGREVETLLRGNVDIDSISLDTGNGVLAKAGKLSVRFRTTAPRDSNTIAAVSTSFRSENIFLDMGDSVKALALKTSASLRMVPSPDNPKKPELIARINLDNLGARMPVAGGYINNASFQMRMKQRESGRRREQQHTRADSAWVQRFDSLRRQNQDSYLSFQLASEDARKLIRDMDLSGSFQCKDMNLRTPFFPLPVKMIQSELGFTTNSLSLTNTRFKAGVSDLMLTGSIEGIQQLLLRNGRLTARLGIESDTLDVNEIIRAIAAGTEFAGSDVNRRDSIAQVVFDDTNDLTGPSDTATGIFVIPRNIDFELDTKLKKAVFSNLLLDNVAGKVIIRNQSLRLPDLQLSSEVGNVDLSLVYKATDKKKANLGLDIKMDRIYIKELLGGFPMIDTLAPMLKSFEGVVSCNMAIMSELDEKSDFILPETSASCYLHGKNMVLLDGETFAEISKMLMFKNKKRNMIDSISVEFIMEDNSLMVFPFMVSIDRYTVGVGGVQNLDMSFDYHISVLKSPLPFKLGLNISGTPDKIKFRLAKAKYKDLFTPAKKQTLASVQVNLRQQMYDHLKKTIDEIINEPSATPSFKSRLMISEDLKQEYFKLDTTTVALPEEIPEESAVPSN
jgi:hypothetical protein